MVWETVYITDKTCSEAELGFDSVVIQKHDCLVMQFPLVWIKPVIEADATEPANELSAAVVAPEYEFHLEFPDAETKVSGQRKRKTCR